MYTLLYLVVAPMYEISIHVFCFVLVNIFTANTVGLQSIYLLYLFIYLQVIMMKFADLGHWTCSAVSSLYRRDIFPAMLLTISHTCLCLLSIRMVAVLLTASNSSDQFYICYTESCSLQISLEISLQIFTFHPRISVVKRSKLV